MSISEGILKEADILLKAVATGMLLMVVYDWLRIIRRLIPHGTWWIAVEDFLFWTGNAIIVFIMLYRENDGYLRGFSIGGVLVGMFLYEAVFSKFVVNGSVFLLEKILYILFRPIVLLGKRILPLFIWGSRKCLKIARFLKKRLKKIWKTVKIGICKL